MYFEWDENKSEQNKRKYGLSFDTAKLVFDDPFHLSVQDRVIGGEERWQTIGMAGGIALTLVAHTYRNREDEEIIRIISARKASKNERRRYAQAD